MTLEQQIQKDLVKAMKEKDQASLRAIRAVKAEILLHKTSGSGEELSDEKAIKMLQKMVKQRKDSLEIYREQGRDDLARTEQEEIEVIQRYLPEQMGEAELVAFVKDLVDELGAESMKDMGRVMGEANKRLSGKAEGKAIAKVVKDLLS